MNIERLSQNLVDRAGLWNDIGNRRILPGIRVPAPKVHLTV